MPEMFKASLTLAGFCVIGLCSPSAIARVDDFGKQWIRSHPFTIVGSTQTDISYFDDAGDLNHYLAAGMTAAFADNDHNHVISTADLAAANGVPWHMFFSPTNTSPLPGYSDSEKAKINELFALGYGQAVMVADERSTPDYPGVAERVQWVNQAHPDALVYYSTSGHGATDPQNPTGTYDLIEATGIDVVMFAAYPYLSDGSDDTDLYFGALMAVRNAALSHNIPYWAYTQSLTAVEGNTFDYWRATSESDTRHNIYTLLTAGYTGINYYRYTHNLEHNGFYDENSNQLSVYDHAAGVNPEAQKLGQSLRFLESTDVRYIPTLKSAPDGLTRWLPGAGNDPHLLSVAVAVQNDYSQKEGLIGHFIDDDGEYYFMLMNLYHGTNLSAADASTLFTIVFDSGVDSIWRLNRLTGIAEEIQLDNHTLSLTLPGGTGDLFKYDNGDFAGVIPEPAIGVLLLAGCMVTSTRRFSRQNNRLVEQ